MSRLQPQSTAIEETTPLLPNSDGSRPKDVYDRFSTVQKRIIVAAISLAGVIAPFASGSFVPCVPEVARDLNTTGTVINYTVGVYLVTMGIGTLVWAPYSGFYGRQPIYLVSLPLFVLGSLVVSLSQNVAQLMIGRMVQAFGASSFMSVGAATISDIYILEERGTAMGVYIGAVLLGPAIAPLAGGLSATYSSWRTMQLILFAMALAAFIFIGIFLPETIHPGSRGLDKLLAEEEKLTPGPRRKRRGWRWVWINPFAALYLLRGPNILFVAITGAFTLMTDIVLLVPMAYTIGPRYGISSPALLGACFIPSGIGNILGAPLAGRLSDRAVINGRKKRGGKWVPEDRLMSTLLGGLIFVPLSVLIAGLATEFVPGTTGLVINLICLFANGIGVDLVLPPSATYNVDILRTKSAEVTAVNSAVRNIICAVTSAAVLPMINTLGVGVTNGLAAVLAWFAYGLVLVTIRYGGRLRAWADIGYTTAERDA